MAVLSVPGGHSRREFRAVLSVPGEAGDQVVDEIDGGVEALDEYAFAAAVGAHIVFVAEDAADAIRGNTGADHATTIGGAGFHGWDDGKSGPELVGAGGDGSRRWEEHTSELQSRMH